MVMAKPAGSEGVATSDPDQDVFVTKMFGVRFFHSNVEHQGFPLPFGPQGPEDAFDAGAFARGLRDAERLPPGLQDVEVFDDQVVEGRRAVLDEPYLDQAGGQDEVIDLDERVDASSFGRREWNSTISSPLYSPGGAAARSRLMAANRSSLSSSLLVVFAPLIVSSGFK